MKHPILRVRLPLDEITEIMADKVPFKIISDNDTDENMMWNNIIRVLPRDEVMTRLILGEHIVNHVGTFNVHRHYIRANNFTYFSDNHVDWSKDHHITIGNPSGDKNFWRPPYAKIHEILNAFDAPTKTDLYNVVEVSKHGFLTVGHILAISFVARTNPHVNRIHDCIARAIGGKHIQPNI